MGNQATRLPAEKQVLRVIAMSQRDPTAKSLLGYGIGLLIIAALAAYIFLRFPNKDANFAAAVLGALFAGVMTFQISNRYLQNKALVIGCALLIGLSVLATLLIWIGYGGI